MGSISRFAYAKIGYISSGHTNKFFGPSAIHCRQTASMSDINLVRIKIHQISHLDFGNTSKKPGPPAPINHIFSMKYLSHEEARVKSSNRSSCTGNRHN